MPLYIGVMSGTSLDSIDAALCEISADKKPELLSHHEHSFPEHLRASLTRLCQPGDNEIERMGRADRELGACYAEAVTALLSKAGVSAGSVSAIGCHGQTIRHRPATAVQPANTAFTLQIGDPNTLAMQTGITTVSDFRRRDIAEGGQGAPLAPAFHRAVFASDTSYRAIVNIGGMANITLLPAKGECSGFDTGPGNVLMDVWVRQQQGLEFDEGGRWAASGKVDDAFLSGLLALPYFQLHNGPRSTGREDFDAGLLADLPTHLSPQDIQASLLEFSAQTIAAPLLRLNSHPSQLYVCGGGAYNTTLMQRLETLLHPMLVVSTEKLGIAPQWVEAIAFAWLAYRRMEGMSGNIPSVTGAAHEALLGAIYPA
ncbi:MAG: anhydro-N-acetylmuramic acid kinase [Bermanella sp.]